MSDGFFATRHRYMWAEANRWRKYRPYLKETPAEAGSNFILLLLSVIFPPLAFITVPYFLWLDHSRKQKAVQLYEQARAEKLQEKQERDVARARAQQEHLAEKAERARRRQQIQASKLQQWRARTG